MGRGEPHCPSHLNCRACHPELVEGTTPNILTVLKIDTIALLIGFVTK